MIRASRPGDEAGLKELWQAAFGDPPTAIEGFFSHLYQVGTAVVWDEDGVIASAIYLLDAGITPLPDGHPLRTAYAYALGTLPAYRGRGIGSEVTRACITRSFELGFDCNVICPAEESLFPYYVRLGYDAVLPITEDKIIHTIQTELSITSKIMSTDPSTYFHLRSTLLPTCAATYAESYLQYVSFVCQASGGGLYQLELNGQTACAAVERRGETGLFIREFLPTSLSEVGIRALLSHFAAESADFRAPASDVPPALKQRPFALAAYAGEQTIPCGDGYFPFVLD